MNLRHLIAAVLAGLLVLAPTTAFAQEGGDGEPDEPTSWEELGDVIADLFDGFVEDRDELGDDPSDEDQSAFDELVETLTNTVADLFGALYFEAVEAAAQDTADELEDEGANGEAVSTLARCAPRGSFGALIEGVAHHGEYVTAAAHGETVQLNVPTIEVTEPDEGSDDETSYEVVPAEEPTDFDLTSTEGATDLCSALDVVYQARLLELEVAWEDVDVHQDARVLVREQCQLQRLRERNGADVDAQAVCAELRQRVKDLHAEARAEARAEREAARAEAQAARDAAKAEREAARAEARENRGRS